MLVLSAMFIRQTKTRSGASGDSYFTHRIVESRRVGRKVSQHTLLNLGSSFDLPKEAWPELCTRIEQIFSSEDPLFAVEPSIEQSAQHIYSQIIARRGELQTLENKEETHDFQEVDINSLKQIKPRSVGAEHVSLEALKELQIPQILEDAGFNRRQRAEALGNIIGRMCAPRSELATEKWLKERSALGELLKYDFSAMPLMQLYRASDRLLKKKDLIEKSIFDRVQNLFNFTPTITLYDLTNTYMEGNASANPKAKRGRSKEKRKDCPLITLGLTLDASGFIRHSKVFDGNVKEGSTLEGTLLQLKTISKGLHKPRCTKKRNAVCERIGRLKEKCKRVSAHYEINMEVDEATELVTQLTWNYKPQENSKQTHPGVYKLRTTLTDWDDENLWRTYTMLTDLESVFRSLKSELGIRPVYHHLEDRCDGHLFITVLAYQAVQVIRRKLKEHGINESWESLREILGQQSRITATFKQRDGKTLHVRKATQPEEELKNIYTKLGISPEPGGIQKMII